jgi:hypothetical protein
MKLKGKYPRGRPRSRWNIGLGNVSHRKKAEHGKKLRWRRGCLKAEIDGEAWLSDD